VTSVVRQRWRAAGWWLLWASVIVACLTVWLFAIVGAVTVFDP
jgi:hypothetical protein